MPTEREKRLSEAGILLETKGSKDYFYSETIGKYVAFNFLKVDERVVKIASQLEIDLDWDKEGRVCNINFTDTRRLLDGLGSHLLTPQEYWQVHEEATKIGHVQALQSLESGDGTEWLDVIFIKKSSEGPVQGIEHPLILPEGSINLADLRDFEQPEARPGWFSPKENIESSTGMPISVSLNREKGTPSWSQATWKYWSTFKLNEFVAGIRGYVTSSGTPSLDLDIPIEARQPVLFIRECRDGLQSPEIGSEILEEFAELERVYLTTLALTPGVKNQHENHEFYKERQGLINFVNNRYSQISLSKEKAAIHIKERLLDMLGIINLEAAVRQDKATLSELVNIRDGIFGLSKEAGGYIQISSFITSSRDRLENAIKENKRTVFVMGHKNPDTDTVISSVFEAYRHSLLDSDTVYIPIVQEVRMPDEIKRLLGDKLSQAYISSSEDIYKRAESLGQARWILVDHNKSEKQRFALSLVDHHILSEVAKRQEIPKTWEMIGSCSAQVCLKLYGLGVLLDAKSARLLHGATLMDTENRGPKKMTYKDDLIMNQLKNLSGTLDEDGFYQNLMGFLLNTDDAERLFHRDYKEDWGIFGFAVAKVKNVFDEDSQPLKPDVLQGLVKEAEANNKEKHFCMTLVKVVDYKSDNQTVNREKVYLVFNDFASPSFRQAMADSLEHIVRNEFGEKAHIERTESSIEFWGVGDQLSRKVTAPEFEALVAAFNEFYFSPSTNLFIKREFLKKSSAVEEAGAQLGIELFYDSKGRICNITYHEAKMLVEQLGYRMLSLPEYWKVLNETFQLNDVQMQEHLRSKGFVEFLDTVILDYQETINHPEVKSERGNVTYKGERLKRYIPTALPALVYPEDIEPDGGFPKVTYESQEKYGDPKTWRYWSPDAKVAIPTRGYIFLLNKPALDSKIHPDDALPNLGIRVATDKVKYPKVTFEKGKSDLKIKIEKEE